MKRKAFIFIFSILMVSCDYIFNIHGDYVELGNDYVFCNRVIGKVYSRENGMVFFNDIVPQQVLNHSQDDNYIVVYQVPTPDGMQAAIDSVRMSQHEIDSIHTLYQKMMDIVDCYWIIRIRDNKVWGPMDYKTYRRMHDELKIEEELDKSYENKYAGEKPKIRKIGKSGTVLDDRKSGTVLDDPFFAGNLLRNMKKDVSLRCWNKNTDSHAKTVSTKKWNRHISRDVERYQQAGYI